MSADKTNEKPAGATLTQDITDVAGRKVASASAHVGGDFPNTVLGNLWRVYTTAGVIAVVVLWSLYSFDKNQRYMQERLDRMWDDVIKLQNDNYERYTKSRELTDKRHADLLAKLDKVVLYIELSAEWQRRQQPGGPQPDLPRPIPPMMQRGEADIDEGRGP